ncbi:MAG: hypothetical protein FWH28_03520 [Clostridiales bacterium]|nr:hypothetical protein [Clostridiales bacterium]
MKALLVSLFLLLYTILLAPPLYASASGVAELVPATVFVNGNTIAVKGFRIHDAYYFKLRNLAYTLSGTAKRFSVYWDDTEKAILLAGGQTYTGGIDESTPDAGEDARFIFSTTKWLLDGAAIALPSYVLGGSHYVTIESLAAIFDFHVHRAGDANTFILDIDEEKPFLSLPLPTGTNIVGMTDVYLVDRTRKDPWIEELPRELMISIWYPAQSKSGAKAPYMQTQASSAFDQITATSAGIAPGSIAWNAVETHAWKDVEAARSDNKRPVILYSPGAAEPRSLGTLLVTELASRGYIVVTVDHTYETTEIAFPGGRIAESRIPERSSAELILKLYDVRVRDIRFVIDVLEAIQKADKPAAGQTAFPAGLIESMDLSRIGMFGHSAGGGTAIQSMYEDERIRAGINMDGTMGYMPAYPLSVVQNGLDRPFMLMNADYNRDGAMDSHLTTLDKAMLWQASSGWKLDIAIPDATHFSYTDYLTLIPQLVDRFHLPPQVIDNIIGTADFNQVLDAQKTLINAFFDQHLKGIPQAILNSGALPYTEVLIVN